MAKIVCEDCETEFVPLKNGVVVIDTAFDPPQPYKLWEADALVCPGCRKIIVGGFANRPFAVHHRADFNTVLADVLEKRTVFWNYEKPQLDKDPARAKLTGGLDCEQEADDA